VLSLNSAQSAVNTSLPAFVAERVLSAGRSAANPPQAPAAVKQQNGQTDGRTPDRYTNLFEVAWVRHSNIVRVTSAREHGSANHRAAGLYHCSLVV